MEGLILDDVEDEEESSWDKSLSGRNCILFLVDSRNEMFSDTNENTYFKESMLCCRDAMLDIARKQRNDLIGVLLYGTKLSEGKYAPDNVVVLQDIAVPSVTIIKRFEEMIKDDFKELRGKYGDVNNADLTRAINYCQVVMHYSKMKSHLKNIVMFTCNDNPCGNNELSAFRARKQANELYLHQIEFDVISFGKEFDSNKLFKELVLTSKGELLKDWENKDPILKIEDLQNQIERLTKKFIRRLSFLRIGSDKSRIILQIALYKLFTEPRKFLKTVKQNDMENGSKSKVEAETKDTTENIESNAEIEEEGEERIDKNNSDLYPFVGERYLNINKAKMRKKLSSNALKMKRGFRLIGFVQTIEVPLFLTIGEPYFVVPHGRNKNNRILFSHFLKKCHERGVSMVGWFSLTMSASPTLTFLHPLEKSTDGKGHSDGFLLVKIPFSDDLFEVDEAEIAINHKPTDQQLEAAKKIISKLTLPYEVNMFNDVEYAARTAMIEALAMDYVDIPEIEDRTDIDLEDVELLLGELNDMFIGNDDSNDSTSARGTKRPGANIKRAGGKHRKQIDAIEMIQNGRANELTAAELKEILKAEGIKSLSSITKNGLVKIAVRRFCSDSQDI